MKSQNNSKKAQFYIISAVIIIFIILSLAAVSNYASVKKQPEKLLQLSDVLKTEGQYVLENAKYNQGNVEQNIQSYVNLFSNYTQQTTSEDFSMVILYGNVNANFINGLSVTKSSTGKVIYDLGDGNTVVISGGNQISVTPSDVHVSSVSATEKTASITITSGNNTLSRTVPVLEDNNFIFVMATNDGFNQYIRENFPKIQT